MGGCQTPAHVARRCWAPGFGSHARRTSPQPQSNVKPLPGPGTLGHIRSGARAGYSKPESARTRDTSQHVILIYQSSRQMPERAGERDSYDWAFT